MSSFLIRRDLPRSLLLFRLPRSVPLLLCPWALVLFVLVLPPISSPSVKPLTTRACTNGPSNANGLSKNTTSNSRHAFATSNSNSTAKRRKPPSLPTTSLLVRGNLGRTPPSWGHGGAANRAASLDPNVAITPHLPAKEEIHDLADADKQCPCCGLPFEPFPGSEDSTILEIDVRAYRRIIRRKRYKPTCTCPDNRGIITAPVPAKLIPKCTFGDSIWVELLLDKYLFYRPTYRLLASLATHGMNLSQGSLTDGLKRLTPLFEPIYQKLVERSRKQKLWHADETRWLVFVICEGKVGYRWYLWVFHAEEVVVFVLAMGRAHGVPQEHFGPVASGILVVDRYKAYQAIDKVKAGLIVLAFCWAHQRRDFLDVARSLAATGGLGAFLGAAHR